MKFDTAQKVFNTFIWLIIGILTLANDEVSKGIYCLTWIALMLSLIREFLRD